MTQKNIIKRIISSPLVQTFLIYVSGGWIALEMTDFFINNCNSNSFSLPMKSRPVTGFPAWFIIHFLKGTFDRYEEAADDTPIESHTYTDWLIKWVKDFSRSIDYLETRSDIDSEKIGFFGHSWGWLSRGYYSCC